jgi:hypothetical protein
MNFVVKTKGPHPSSNSSKIGRLGLGFAAAAALKCFQKVHGSHLGHSGSLRLKKIYKF